MRCRMIKVYKLIERLLVLMQKRVKHIKQKFKKVYYIIVMNLKNS